MTSKHTPGPWHLGADGRIRNADNTMIAETFWNPTVRASGMHANALLVAAAPDLLAALRRALDEGCLDLPGVRAAAVAAIAKADPGIVAAQHAMRNQLVACRELEGEAGQP